MVVFKAPAVRALGKGVVEVGKRWWNHNHSRSAAALAFYSLFSMVPILLVVTQMATALIGRERAQEGVEQATEIVFDETSSTYLQDLLRDQPGAAFTGISSVIGFFVLLFTAAKVVVELREVLTNVFGKRHREGRRGMVIELFLSRAVPILLVLVLGAVVGVSAIAGGVLKVVSTHIDGLLPVNLQLWWWMQKFVPLIMVTLLFALILRWLPPRPPSFRDSLIGALVACLLLGMLRSAIVFYFGQSSVTTVYGAAVTLVVVLLWIYFTIQIFFIGAETTAYLDRMRRGEMEDGEVESA